MPQVAHAALTAFPLPQGLVLFFFPHSGMKLNKDMQFFFMILRLSCDLYSSSPEACGKTFSYVLKIIQKIE